MIREGLTASEDFQRPRAPGETYNKACRADEDAPSGYFPSTRPRLPGARILSSASKGFLVAYRFMERGFFSSLFDISFTSYVTTKIIKVIYVLTLIGIALFALFFVVAGFRESTGLGLFVLVIGAPVGALIYTIYARVFLEFIIQVFRISELLRDQNTLQRAAFSAAGWLPGDATPGPAPTAPALMTPGTCPHCGAGTAPGAQFCRACGQKLT
jgi:hypothetical protein